MNKRLWPFFCFYGGKWRATKHYPAPMHDSIVEPFAGAAGYSLNYPDRYVVLNDLDPVLAGLWRYLISVSETEIRRLPLAVAHVQDVKECQEARWLIGFWLNKAAATPHLTPSKWMRDGWRPKSFWGPEIRERIASQLAAIRHWRVIEGCFSALENRAGSLSGALVAFADYPDAVDEYADRLGAAISRLAAAEVGP